MKDRFPTFLERQSFYSELRFDHSSVYTHYLKGNDHSESILFKKKKKWRFNKNVTRRTFNGGSVIVKNTHIVIKKLFCLNLRYNVFSYIDAIYSNKYGERLNSKIYKCWSYPNLNLQWHRDLVYISDHNSMLYHMFPTIIMFIMTTIFLASITIVPKIHVNHFPDSSLNDPSHLQTHDLRSFNLTLPAQQGATVTVSPDR